MEFYDLCHMFSLQLWLPNEHREQNLLAMGSAKPDVRRASEDINGDETLAIKMLCFVECARVGIDTKWRFRLNL